MIRSVIIRNCQTILARGHIGQMSPKENPKPVGQKSALSAYDFC